MVSVLTSLIRNTKNARKDIGRYLCQIHPQPVSTFAAGLNIYSLFSFNLERRVSLGSNMSTESPHELFTLGMPKGNKHENITKRKLIIEDGKLSVLILTVYVPSIVLLFKTFRTLL